MLSKEERLEGVKADIQKVQEEIAQELGKRNRAEEKLKSSSFPEGETKEDWRMLYNGAISELTRLRKKETALSQQKNDIEKEAGKTD